MLSHLTIMIAALSLALTAGSSPGWPWLSSMVAHRCFASHDHGRAEQSPRGEIVTIDQRRVHDVRVLSFGP